MFSSSPIRTPLARRAAEEGAAWGGGFRPEITGLTAETLVETDTGWRPVRTLVAGDRVQTLDGGLQPLRAVTARSTLGRAPNLVTVPGGTLDTCSDLTLMADARVLIDAPQAEATHGASLVLVPAGALAGWHGVTLQRGGGAGQGDILLTLAFDDDEIVFANTGAMIHCAGETRSAAPMGGLYPVLSYVEARDLLGLPQEQHSTVEQIAAARRAAFRVVQAA
jgi:hypothetical protein